MRKLKRYSSSPRSRASRARWALGAGQPQVGRAFGGSQPARGRGRPPSGNAGQAGQLGHHGAGVHLRVALPAGDAGDHLLDQVGGPQDRVQQLPAQQQRAAAQPLEDVLQPVSQLAQVGEADQGGLALQGMSQTEYLVHQLQVGAVLLQLQQAVVELLQQLLGLLEEGAQQPVLVAHPALDLLGLFRASGSRPEGGRAEVSASSRRLALQDDHQGSRAPWRSPRPAPPSSPPAAGRRSGWRNPPAPGSPSPRRPAGRAWLRPAPRPAPGCGGWARRAPGRSVSRRLITGTTSPPRLRMPSTKLGAMGTGVTFSKRRTWATEASGRA